jgi:hypothetical protein
MDRESSSSELTTAAGSDAPSPRPFALPGHSGDQKVAHILVEFDRQRAAGEARSRKVECFSTGKLPAAVMTRADRRIARTSLRALPRRMVLRQKGPPSRWRARWCVFRRWEGAEGRTHQRATHLLPGWILG